MSKPKCQLQLRLKQSHPEVVAVGVSLDLRTPEKVLPSFPVCLCTDICSPSGGDLNLSSPFFCLYCSLSYSSHGSKLHRERFRLDMRNSFF